MKKSTICAQRMRLGVQIALWGVLAAVVVWSLDIGPDSFGYIATDAAPYSFVDISCTGVAALAGTDEGTATVNVGFPFSFYGKDYSTVCISSNGLLSLGGCNPLDFANQDLSATIPAGTGLTRSLQWLMAYEAAMPNRPLALADGGADRLHSARLFIGYGPETSKDVSSQHMPAQLVVAYGGYFVPDRFHNDFWDTLLTTGILGLIARVALFGCICFFALRSLRIQAISQTGLVFWACYLGCGILGGMVLAAWLGMGFLGLGFCGGTATGLILYLVCIGCFCIPATREDSLPRSRAILIMALLAAIIAHLVELALSFPVGTTAAYFWIWVALLFTVGKTLPARESAAEDGTTHILGSSVGAEHPSSGSRPRGAAGSRQPQPMSKLTAWRDEMVGGLLLALVLATLGFELLRKGYHDSPFEIILSAVTRLPGTDNAFSLIIGASIVFVCLLFGIVWVNEERLNGSRRPWFESFGVVLSSSAVLALLFWFAVASHLADMSPLTPSNPQPDVNRVGEYESLTWFYYGFHLVVIALMAYALPDRRRVVSTVYQRDSLLAWVAALFVAAIALVCIFEFNLRWTFADTAAARAKLFRESGQWEVASSLYLSSIETAPFAASYDELLGRALTRQAVQSADAQQRAVLLGRAEHAFERGQRLMRFNPDFASGLADVCLNRALFETEKGMRLTLARTAQDSLARALKLEPVNYELWYKRAVIDLVILGDSGAALAGLRRAVQIFPDYDKAHALVGDAHVVEARTKTRIPEHNRLLAEAAISYEKAIAVGGLQYSYCRALAATYAALGNVPKAIEFHLKSYGKAPPGERWEVDKTLGQLYFGLGNREAALFHVQRALQQVSGERARELADLYQTLGQARREEKKLQ